MPIRIANAWILAFGLAGAAGLSEQESQHPIDATLEQCMASSQGVSTHGMLDCIRSAGKSWDRELNRVWAALKSELPKAAMDPLRVSQRQWIAFRDAEIAALDATYGAMQGSMYQPMHAEAVAALTRDRTRQLESTLEAWRVSAQ